VAVYKDDHNIDQLMFDPKLRPGQAGYGAMYVGVGDGGNVPSRPDPYNQAQNLGRALGKILRINPLRQPGGKPYGIPADNPFVGRAGALPEIWAYGLRHPLNMSFDTGGNGALIITDIGQEHVEEVNLGVKGANYGWPEREGTYVTDRRDGTVLYAPPADDTARGFTFPVAQYDHYEGGPVGLSAITGGFVYRGTAVPALAGQYLFGDLVTGRVFHVPASNLKLGRRATIRELTLKRAGVTVTLKGLAGAARADLRFGQDQAGEVYVMSKQDGVIRKLGPA
jgi:glucose/arabinose dehydrogenase